ncbi:hypothetical protein RclHR1_15480006 [Rhizophagus clarus]|uniref:DUF6570 domain-containing protein n=1 Tax=Rhizophagus clarus TaxID=94130 RepID=A0A2Z6QF71_9GLOM|nr:hypothetical protein RclHR1_15480006 [Rhizophagus clarus]
MQIRPVIEPSENDEQSHQEIQRNNETPSIQSTPLSSNTISEEERSMLKKFWKKMDSIQYNLCPIYNERILSMTLFNGKCQRCFKEKFSREKENLLPEKFSAENNMDLGEVPEELKGLSEIKKMLIAQIFTVITVYRL